VSITRFPDDVPSPIDLREPATAAQWTAEADVKRPYRADVRRAIAGIVAEVGRARVVDAAKLGILDAARVHVLELGCGPGLLAEAILDACDVERYVCLDFSQPMLDMARERNGDRAQYVQSDFRDELPVDGPFDAIVSMQAIHELRHKRHAEPLYTRLRPFVRPGGAIVICDHQPDGLDKPNLAMTDAEQITKLTAAGFANARLVSQTGTLYIVRADQLGST
jgi:SAM-dependent methyltransferase